MRKIYFSSILLPLSLLGFSQIPNLPTREQPNISTFQNYSDRNFTTSQKNQNIPSLPSSFSSSNASRVQQQNMMIVQNDLKRIETEEKVKKQQMYSDEVYKQDSKIFT